MAYPLRNIEHGFSWFYNAPIWADIAAPVIGGFLIWRLGFSVVFSLSVAIIAFALIVVATRLRIPSLKLNGRQISWSNWLIRWRNLFKHAADKKFYLI